MIDKLNIPKSVNWGGKVKRLNLLVVMALLLLLVMPMASPLTQQVARVQPLLLEMAAQQPDQVVSVIVQKTAKDDRVEQAVSALGGRVTKDLHIINALAAEMKAKDVPQLAQANGVLWVSLDAPVHQSDQTQFTTWSTGIGTTVPNGFVHGDWIVDSSLGPSGTFGYGSNVTGAFGGFVAEATPNNAISKVEVVLHSYTYAQLGPGEDPQLRVYVSGVSGASVTLDHHAFDTHATVDNAGLIYLDITASRSWKWSDFDNGLELVIDQTSIATYHIIFYDAVGLRVTSTSGSDAISDTGADTSPDTTIDASQQTNVYNQVIQSSSMWNSTSKLRGKGMTVAVLDSGIARTKDLERRVRANVNFNGVYHSAADRYGHGTFVAGIIAGNGVSSGGKYIGVAPKTNLLNVRISDDQGMSTESDVVDALQWVLNNRVRYNIRVVNLSLNSGVAQSYQTSPLDAAVEILWFNRIVVVVSAGNNGTATLFPPANDPFVITVGATDDKGTVSTSDDVVATFSAYGTTESGFAKPDLVAPGRNIIGILPENDKLNMSKNHAGNRIDTNYFRMSGTSVSAPMVSGAVAILLQDEPNLNPDQVKYRLIATANKNWPGYNATTAGAGYLDIYSAVYGATTQSSNTGIAASQLLWTGSNPIAWGSVQWNSVQWNSVQWNSVQWNSVQWNSVQWNSDYWGP